MATDKPTGTRASELAETDTAGSALSLIAEQERALWAVVDELADARRTIDEAERRLSASRDAADRAMRRYGTALDLEDERVTRETLFRLYWEHPDIRVKGISDAFGIPGGPGTVHTLTGATSATLPCRNGCGRQMTVSSRTEAATRRFCPSCLDEIHAEMAARNKFWAGKVSPFELETRAWIREQLAAGQSPAQIRDAYDPEDTDSLSRAIVAGWLIDEVSRN